MVNEVNEMNGISADGIDSANNGDIDEWAESILKLKAMMRGSMMK